MSHVPRILVVDDEESMCHFMEIMLKKEGYAVTTAQSGHEALAKLDKAAPDLVISDIMMPEMSGIELLTAARQKRDKLRFIVMTAFASVDSAVDALKKGADDYITKPFKIDEIKQVIKNLLQDEKPRTEVGKFQAVLAERFTLDRFVGESTVVKRLKDLVTQVAGADTTVLILGESGTGKDLIARAIHGLSRRSSQPFVAINCGAIPELLLESELFGHKRGSFTGAIKDKEGLYQAANGGVLFLDEIGNLSPALQVKLLRVLETQEYTPVGATTPQRSDVRLIAATNANLEEEVKQNRFRADLFYRLNVLPVWLPTLAERREDIPQLANHFLEKVARKHGTPKKQLAPEAEALICDADWPGNVRELENTITRACLLSRTETITSADIPDKHMRSDNTAPVAEQSSGSPTLESIERAYIYWVLKETGWQKTKAAKLLGIDASTLYRKIEKYGLKKDGE